MFCGITVKHIGITMQKKDRYSTVETIEKRQAERKEVIESICFSHFNDGGGLSSQGKGLAVNISPMGMQIQIRQDLPVNTKILIEVFFPTEIHRYTGEIAWTNKIEENVFSIGVRILFKKIVYR